MKNRTKRLTTLLLVGAMAFSTIFASGCNGGTTVSAPQLRINEKTNYWEVSYDNGTTWESFEVKATADPIIPLLQINAETNEWEVSYDEGTTWVAMGVKATGEAGVAGKAGKDGADGKDGVDGEDGKDGNTPYIGTDGYWYIGGVNTGVFAGMPEEPDVIDETFKKVAELTKNVAFGRANCQGTTNCFGSVYWRVLADDHKFYDGAAGIANYLKGVFTEDANGNVSVNMNSALGGVSYTDALTMINFASAFSSYNEYIIRNNQTMPADIAAQRELAIKYFNTVDYTASGYHDRTGGAGLTYPSRAVAVVAMGALLEQMDTARYDTLIKNAYDNVKSDFWDANTYLQPFYQLCAKYDWYDMSSIEDSVSAETALDTADVLRYYAYGIDLENDYPALWDAFEETALSDNALDASEAKAFAYHYAYQLSDGDVYLGVYGSSRNIVDYSVVDTLTE